MLQQPGDGEKLIASDKRCKGMSMRWGLNRSACAVFVTLVVVVLLFLHNIFGGSSSFAVERGKSSVFGDMNYGVIIDAGSTGSRLFLYGWRSSSPDELIEIRPVNDHLSRPVVKKVTPGLSTFGDKPEMAAEYIKPLLDYAAQFVEPKKHTTTPIFIFATAGMRLLSTTQQNAVMNALHERLPAMTEFRVLPANIQVISGTWEGTYSWIAVNYMLGRFGATAAPTSALAVPVGERPPAGDTPRRPNTAGVIDMGGASAQIAFELPADNAFTNENVLTINLGGHESDTRFRYKLFVTTFLGFGANEGAKKYEELLLSKLRGLYESAGGGSVVADNATATGDATPAVEYMRDGCLPRNFLKLVTKEDGRQFVRKGTGLWDDCVNDLAYLLFHSPEARACPPERRCFFGGVVAPGISLSDVELYGFSEYWFSVEDVLSLGGVYNHDEFERKAKSFCEQSWTQIRSKAAGDSYPHADEERLQTQCFKSAWIHAVLHNGFFVDEKRHHFQSSFKINGEEVQWALGAMIYQMRHFPLTAARAGNYGSADGATVHGSYSLGWTLFYLLAIAVLLYALYATAVRRYDLIGGVANRASLMKKSSSVPSEFIWQRDFFRDV